MGIYDWEMGIGMDEERLVPRHYTREPWWVVAVAAVVMAVLPILDIDGAWGLFGQAGFLGTIGIFAGLGAAGAGLLVLRSHIRSVFWAGCLLWLGMVVIAVGICLILEMFIK